MRQPFFVYLPTGVGSPGDSRYYQVITSPRTGHIQELPLRGVDLFKVTFVTNRFYALRCIRLFPAWKRRLSLVLLKG